MNAYDENHEATDTSAPNPFPEPQTIPLGWDTSELYSKPQAATEQADDWDESESE